MKKKTLRITSLAVSALLLFVFCVFSCHMAAAADSAGKVRIGVTLPTKDESRWLQDEAQFQALIGETDYSIEVMFSQRSSAVERANIETLIAKGIEVLIITAPDAAAAAATVEAAKAEGVTIIAYDRLITGTDAVDYYVTFDSIEVGAAQAQHLVDNVEGKNNPLYLYAGAMTDNNAYLLFEGSWNVLQPKIADGTFVIKNSSEAEKYKDRPSLTVDNNREELAAILGQITTNWNFNDAKSKAEANLTSATAADKGVCYILAANDDTARPIADVFDADSDVTKYYIGGQDAEIATIQYIIDGKQTMTVFKDTRLLTRAAIDMAISILEGKTPTTERTYNNTVKDVPSKLAPIVVVTKDNVKEAMIDSGYYSASEFTGLQ